MRLLDLLAPLTLAAVFVPSTQAQCFGPDGLDSAPCCSPVPLNLPPLPPISMIGQADTWDSCSLATQDCTLIEISPPTPTPLCGQFEADIKIVDCAGNSLMGGRLILDYTRTWDEAADPTVPGATTQVWRFVAKADIELQASVIPFPPQVPNALTSGVPSVFYYGYVDYAFDCATGAFENSVVLYHGCDLFQHMPTYSAYPGVYDPTTSYAIVGPDTLANPFVPSITPLSGGPLVGEAIRRMEPTCLAEDQVAQGALSPIVDACMCPLSFVAPQHTLAKFEAAGFCGNNVRSLNVFPTLPYLHTVTTSLGRWSNGANYPGPEVASVVEGIFQHVDTCPTTGIVQVSVDINYGGVTRGGYPVFSPVITPNNSTFIDMASNWRWQPGTPLSFPLIGFIQQTRHLTYVNL